MTLFLFCRQVALHNYNHFQIRLCTMTDIPNSDLVPDSWMVRPCEFYKAEYKDCKSLKARFNQYFIFGETIDCLPWKRDYDNCVRWMRNENVDACKSLVDSEKERRRKRLEAHYNNNVWKRRVAPPEDWNKPLPEWMEDRNKNTYLDYRSLELKGVKVKEDPDRTFCVIS